MIKVNLDHDCFRCSELHKNAVIEHLKSRNVAFGFTDYRVSMKIWIANTGETERERDRQDSELEGKEALYQDEIEELSWKKCEKCK